MSAESINFGRSVGRLFGMIQKSTPIKAAILAVFVAVVIIMTTIGDKPNQPSPTQPPGTVSAPSVAFVDPPPVELTKADIQKKEAIDRRLGIEKRERHAALLEDKYLSAGMNVYVSLQGKEKTTIQLKYVLISRPHAHNLAKDAEFIGGLRAFGYKKLILFDGYNEKWTIDL